MSGTSYNPEQEIEDTFKKMGKVKMRFGGRSFGVSFLRSDAVCQYISCNQIIFRYNFKMVTYFIIIPIIIIASFSSVCAQEFKVPIIVSDGENSVELIIGVHAEGTVEYNSKLDVFAPPQPPPGVFDARLRVDREEYVRKILDNTLEEKIFHVRSQVAAGQQSITLEWDNEFFEEMGTFVIRVGEDEFNMDEMSSFEIPNDEIFGNPSVIAIAVTPDLFFPPDPPLLSAPLHQEIIYNDTVLLQWSEYNSTGYLYDVEIAKDVDFIDILYRAESIPDTVYVFRFLEGEISYWWRVRTRRPAGPGEYSAPWNFIMIAAPGAPLLAYPPNDTAGVETKLTLHWEETERAENYHVQLAEDELFAVLIIDAGNAAETEFKVDELDYATTYYWRVKAMNKGGESDWSEIWRFTTADVTGIPAGTGIPRAYTLSQNYPNPFNPSTVIRYGIPERCRVTLTVYNPLGQKVATIVNEEQEAQYYEVVLDAAHLTSGVYIYRFQAGEYVESKKLLYIR